MTQINRYWLKEQLLDQFYCLQRSRLFPASCTRSQLHRNYLLGGGGGGGGDSFGNDEGRGGGRGGRERGFVVDSDSELCSNCLGWWP